MASNFAQGRLLNLRPISGIPDTHRALNARHQVQKYHKPMRFRVCQFKCDRTAYVKQIARLSRVYTAGSKDAFGIRLEIIMGPI